MATLRPDDIDWERSTEGVLEEFLLQNKHQMSSIFEPSVCVSRILSFYLHPFPRNALFYHFVNTGTNFVGGMAATRVAARVCVKEWQRMSAASGLQTFASSLFFVDSDRCYIKVRAR